MTKTETLRASAEAQNSNRLKSQQELAASVMQLERLQVHLSDDMLNLKTKTSEQMQDLTTLCELQGLTERELRQLELLTTMSEHQIAMCSSMLKLEQQQEQILTALSKEPSGESLKDTLAQLLTPLVRSLDNLCQRLPPVSSSQ